MMVSIKKPSEEGIRCPDRMGLDSLRITRVSLSCDQKDSDDYTDSSVYYNPPILYIRRSFQAVGVSAYQLTASPINPDRTHPPSVKLVTHWHLAVMKAPTTSGLYTVQAVGRGESMTKPGEKDVNQCTRNGREAP